MTQNDFNHTLSILDRVKPLYVAIDSGTLSDKMRSEIFKEIGLQINLFASTLSKLTKIDRLKLDRFIANTYGTELEITEKDFLIFKNLYLLK